MKKIFSLLLIALTLTAHAQIKISELPTKTGDATGLYVPVVDGSTTKKTTGASLSYTKIDSLRVVAGVVHVRKNGGAFIPQFTLPVSGTVQTLDSILRHGSITTRGLNVGYSQINGADFTGAINGQDAYLTQVNVTGQTSLTGPLFYQPGAGAGKVLTSDATGNASWQDMVSGIVPFNYISETFNGSALPAGFTAIGSPSYTVSGSYINFTGTGATNFTKGVINNKGVLTEKNTIEATLKIKQTPSSLSKGLAFGLLSYNTHNAPANLMFGLVTDTSSANFGKVYMSSTYATTYGTTVNTDINLNDVINFKLVRNGLSYNLKVKNITQDWEQVLAFEITNSSTPIAGNNSANLAIMHLGGDFSVDSIKYTINKPASLDFIIIGNSITYGQGSTNQFIRFVNNFGNYQNNIGSGGGSDASAEVLARLDEIIALHPKRIILHDVVGNDILFGVPSGTWQANLTSIFNTLVNAGEDVYITNGQPRTYNDETAQKTFIEANFPKSKIIDTWSKLVGTGYALKPEYDADATHPSNFGHLGTADVLNEFFEYQKNLSFTEGTTNYLPKFAGTKSLSNSVIREDAGNVTIETGGYSATPKGLSLGPSAGSNAIEGDRYKNLKMILLKHPVADAFNYGLGFSSTVNGDWMEYYAGISGSHVFMNGGGAISGIIRENGRIGFGTLLPDEKLHVIGNVKLSGNLITGAPSGSSVSTMKFGQIETGSDGKDYQKVEINGFVKWLPVLSALP